MSYSMVTMRQSLKNLGNSKGVNPFLWEQKGMTGVVNPLLTNEFKYGRGQNFVNDLLEYCWLVYSKALNSVGLQLAHGRSLGFTTTQPHWYQRQGKTDLVGSPYQGQHSGHGQVVPHS